MRKLSKDIREFGGAGISLGIGTAISAKAGASSVTPAFGTAAGMMRPVGVGMMGGHALRKLKKTKWR